MRTDRKKTAKYILTVLTIAWCIMIFSFSSVRAIRSNDFTLKKAGFLSSLLVSGYNEKTIREQIDINALVHYLLRKAAHITEFAVLGALLVADIYLWFKPGRTALVISSLLTGAAYAISDEIHQYFVPGRSCELKDILIDSAGVTFGVILGTIVINITKNFSLKKPHRK